MPHTVQVCWEILREVMWLEDGEQGAGEEMGQGQCAV